ncbi:dynamin family protein [Paenibacillus nasutitermitis]|uniref:Dynamin N-terminal domain-containing protein n=1 Tax=Paenibacillus nasutitermitis TaxID=1652958 RepID=A0A917DSK6_9BACL|nr:dynamin family protein [Paenibacillus nasutitermitis]GGD64755.1 hypothetical protein GCM10010911_23170 [Paenibacillus nasutitermitis]
MNPSIATAVHPLEAALKQIGPLMDEAGDKRNAERLLELRGKLNAGRLAVAFCGHFSAGKSTLVNRLCGAELLPSSPIPTSANVVTIENGDPKATLTRTKGGREETLAVPLDQLDDYCKDGEGVQSIALTYPIPRLGDHTVLLDTPGIDSTDDAHRMATESALHLADVVFYVMDYNHVQSEINFSFAKQLKDWGKPLYLIVNQIDKHRDSELSFEAYRRSVDQAFANWHLEPSGVVYLSLREPGHPHSEWVKLEELLANLAQLRGPLALCSVDASARHLIRAHGKVLDELAEPQRERLISAAGGEDGAEHVAEELSALKGTLNGIEQEAEGLRTRLRLDMQRLLDNANVTPAPTRDLAQSFLESRKPGFKMGLLFSGGKTAAEQEKRLEAFKADFESLVKAGIEWHLLDMLRKAADGIGWRGEEMEQQLIAAITGPVEAEWLLNHVNTGAVFGSEYTINYCRELAADVKGIYRKRAMGWIDILARHAEAAGEAASAPVRERLGMLAVQAAALEELSAIAERAAAHQARLAAMLPPAPVRPALPVPRTAKPPEMKESLFEPAPRAVTSVGTGGGAIRNGASPDQARTGNPPGSLHGSEPDAKSTGPDDAFDGTGEAGHSQRGHHTSRTSDALEMTGAASDMPHSATSSDIGGGALAPQRKAAERLYKAADLLEANGDFASAVQAMRDKADRLQGSRFTIALFGAFSAGKSSLANALLGDAVLPVSPNPTTAAVNCIVPPTGEKVHGTASVLLKTREAMLDDLRYSLSLLGEPAERMNPAQLLDSIARLTPDGVHAGGRPHYSFLKAAQQGWQEHEALLGGELHVDGEMYRRYVAEEMKSCFVREIELYHHNTLTAQGIVLVDTPGADSVNARHTGVAFNYIKNADAILFVTYYNHAFSQADRQFLLQLGRVKDQFELDKMFFIVNAADLASGSEELGGVLAHVERNLQQQGIRFPRIFPVSSLQALDGKQRHDSALTVISGIAAFEEAFLSFTRDDLGQLAVASAELELERSGRTLDDWIEAASGDAASRAKAAEELRTAADTATVRMRELEQSMVRNNPQLFQELKELLFYVLQRVQLRFGEHYNFAFNPAVLQDDGRDLRKALWTSWLELQRLLQIELAQELQATSLRLDNTLNRLAAKQFSDLAGDVGQVLHGFHASAFKPLEMPTPEEQPPWQAEAIDSKWLWSRFKSPRHFFEGEGKGALRSALEAELTEPLQQWISQAESQWEYRYADFWQEAAQSIVSVLLADIGSFTSGKLSSITGNSNLDELRELQQRLQDL